MIRRPLTVLVHQRGHGEVGTAGAVAPRPHVVDPGVEAAGGQGGRGREAVRTQVLQYGKRFATKLACSILFVCLFVESVSDDSH